MNLLAKAFNIDADKKELAENIYKKALRRLTDSFGAWEADNAHTQLSVEFGELWVLHVECGRFDSEAVRRASNAFNYANLKLGANNRILETAQQVLGRQAFERAYVLWLTKSANDFDAMLTNV